MGRNMQEIKEMIQDFKLYEIRRTINDLKDELVDELKTSLSNEKRSYIVERLNDALHAINNAQRKLKEEPSLEARDLFEEECVSDLNEFLSIPEEPVREVPLTGNFYEGLEEEYSAFLKKKCDTNK